jgi:nucleoside-triphosphatase THEP1
MDLNGHIHLLSGPVQGGKTTYMAEQVDSWKNKGLRVKGFLCPGLMAGGRRAEFSLMNVQTGHKLLMGREEKIAGWVKYRRFYFNPEAFRQGTAWIKEALAEPTDLLLIDEVGPMELEGLGWSELLDSLEQQTSTKQLWVVREELVPEVSRRWHIPEQLVYTTKFLKIPF